MAVTNVACMHTVERAHHQTYQNHVVWEIGAPAACGGLGCVVRVSLMATGISISIGISITILFWIWRRQQCNSALQLVLA